MELNPLKQKYCPYCSSIKNKNLFYTNPMLYGEYLPLCKACSGVKFREAEKYTGSKWAALWSVCMEQGVPLFRERFDVLKKQYEEADGKSTKNTPFVMYLDLLQDARTKYRGVFDSDMQLSDFISINTIPEEMTKDDMDEKRRYWDKVWGNNYTAEQCIKLDDYYDAYTSDIFDMDAGRALRYRDLCKAELRKFEGDTEKETTEEILKLMKLLKIDNFTETRQSETEKFIERMAWKIENEKPAECEDLEKYKDFSGFEPTWKHIMRCVQNLICGTRDYPDVPKDEQ